MRLTTKPAKALALSLIAAAVCLTASAPASADCNFSGGKIFKLTKERGKAMEVFTTYSGSGKYFRFTTNDKVFQEMLTAAFFNKQRIYVTGANDQCEVQYEIKLGTVFPKLGGKIKRITGL